MSIDHHLTQCRVTCLPGFTSGKRTLTVVLSPLGFSSFANAIEDRVYNISFEIRYQLPGMIGTALLGSVVKPVPEIAVNFWKSALQQFGSSKSISFRSRKSSHLEALAEKNDHVVYSVFDWTNLVLEHIVPGKKAVVGAGAPQNVAKGIMGKLLNRSQIKSKMLVLEKNEEPTSDFEQLMASISVYRKLMIDLGLAFELPLDPMIDQQRKGNPAWQLPPQFLVGAIGMPVAANAPDWWPLKIPQFQFLTKIETQSWRILSSAKNPFGIDSDWVQLNDSTRYAIRTFDERHALNLFAGRANTPGAELQMPPGLRTLGVAVIDKQLGSDLSTLAADVVNLEHNLGAGAASPYELDGTLLVRGIRFDISYDGKTWLSLGSRISRHDSTFLPLGQSNEQGWVSFQSLQELTHEVDNVSSALAEETILRWIGWSPSVGLPSRKAQPHTTAILNSTDELTLASLPMLRFRGDPYYLRGRVVYLDGSGPLLTDDPPSGLADRCIAKVYFHRWEPINAPIVSCGPKMLAGTAENAHVLCMRTTPDETGYSSWRHLFPPLTSHEILEWSGCFDTNSIPDPRKFPLLERQGAFIEPGADEGRALSRQEVDYLPDIWANGVAVTHSDAEFGVYTDLVVIDVKTLGWTRETWPHWKSFPIELVTGDLPSARLENDRLVVVMPPGMDTFLKFRSTSSFPRAGAATIPHSLVGDEARMTPAGQLRVVHALQVPIGVPVLKQDDVGSLLSNYQSSKAINPDEKSGSGSTRAIIRNLNWFWPTPPCGVPALGVERVDLHLGWKELQVDRVNGVAERLINSLGQTVPDPASPQPGAFPAGGTTFTASASVPSQNYTLVLPDNRHYAFDLKPVTISRFQSFYKSKDPADFQLTSDKGISLHVPNSGIPSVLSVARLTPCFEWHESDSLRQRLASRLRLYLQPPFNTSGPNEKIGIVLLKPDQPETPSGDPRNPVLHSTLSEDPAVSFGRRTKEILKAEDLGLDPSKIIYADCPTSEDPTNPMVYDLKTNDAWSKVLSRDYLLAGYVPQPVEGSDQYYVDLSIPSADSLPGSFIRLILVRFQPFSLDGHFASPPVYMDFFPLGPSRSLSVLSSAQGGGLFEVHVSGAGLDADQKGIVLQACLESLGSAYSEELSWNKEGDVKELLSLPGPAAIPTRGNWFQIPQPRLFRRYRIAVEEFNTQISSRRVVYADVLEV